MKNKKLDKILPGGRSLILAFDHGFEHGPAKYDGIELSPLRIQKIAEQGGADAVLVHKGVLHAMKKPRVPVIVKLTARTSMAPEENEMQELVTEVEDALELGASAVAVTVYLGALREADMLANYRKVYHKCLEYGVPLVAFMYPRPENHEERTDEEYVRYAARVGAELDADIIKTYYTGSRASWKKVVADSFKPVVAAGGQLKGSEAQVISMARDIMAAGGAGLAIGRNVWTRDDGAELLKKLSKIVHGK